MTSIPEADGRRFSTAVALNGSGCFHARRASTPVRRGLRSSPFPPPPPSECGRAIRGCSPVAGRLSEISSHIHCPLVEKLKYLPRIAYPFMNVILRPVGSPLSASVPVSSSVVLNKRTSITSPPTPLISTQSPTWMPFLPMSTNQPRNAMMKSCRAIVSAAVARPRIVGVSAECRKSPAGSTQLRLPGWRVQGCCAASANAGDQGRVGHQPAHQGIA